MQNKDTITRNRLFWNKYSHKITLGAPLILRKQWHGLKTFLQNVILLDIDMGNLSQLMREKEAWRTYWCNPVPIFERT